MIVVADTSPLNYLIRLGHPKVSATFSSLLALIEIR
jgi:hypothetical protein